jgi:hypothetical protein
MSLLTVFCFLFLFSRKGSSIDLQRDIEDDGTHLIASHITSIERNGTGERHD